MIAPFADTLDEALEAVKTEPITAVLHRYPIHAHTLAPLLAAAEKLSEWQMLSALPAEAAVSPRLTADWQSADRATFLAQLAQLPAPPVSSSPLLRLRGWLTQLRSAFHNRNKNTAEKPLNAIFARAIAATLLLFSLGSGTVALANDSLPDTPLYPIKMMLEQTRMAMAGNPVEQATLQTELAQVRLEEMARLALTGETIGAAQLVQLQNHLQTALQLAAQTGDSELVALLTQLQTMLQNMQQTIAQLGEPVQAMLGDAQSIMNRYQEQAQAGVADPQTFRWRHMQGENWESNESHKQNGQEVDIEEHGPYGSGDGNCQDEACEPGGDQMQFGQDENNANGPNDPNDSDCINNENCEPVGGANHYGQDGNNSGQHGNGNFDGDGTCDGEDCAPIGDANQYGQGDANTGEDDIRQNSPSDGDGVCTNDCIPFGESPQPNPDNGNANGHGNGG